MKIGLFGGTFNPIHIGHITLAERVKDKLGLDRLVFVPSKLPPHKKTAVTRAEDRYTMVKMVADKLGEGYEVSDFELNSPGISYTYNTLSEYRKSHPDDELFFITGTDIFATIGSWQYWNELFYFANFVVVSRKEVPFDTMMTRLPEVVRRKVRLASEYSGCKAGEILLFPMDEIVISSTEIRYQIAQDRCGDIMLMSEVYDYIVEHNLYLEV